MLSRSIAGNRLTEDGHPCEANGTRWFFPGVLAAYTPCLIFLALMLRGVETDEPEPCLPIAREWLAVPIPSDQEHPLGMDAWRPLDPVQCARGKYG